MKIALTIKNMMSLIETSDSGSLTAAARCRQKSRMSVFASQTPARAETVPMPMK
eukprot:CAMPEP_0181459250 /NCGR_PEP_ID=MMETSP1110-20121109/32730_1 /TAXON_ID=174948 /ORGANISM="Symbiodinium sp., Strain CCMP421" /LENGTH=53 /DNA_ID=CAMNT_0023583767 /DNA_START=522 /DNA_END=680 /DNA_ORIENTATION=+